VAATKWISFCTAILPSAKALGCLLLRLGMLRPLSVYAADSSLVSDMMQTLAKSRLLDL